MFMDTGKPGPPPMAEGMYWLLAPAAVVFATLPFIGWFVGQVMKASGGKANPQAVNDLLKKKLGL